MHVSLNEININNKIIDLRKKFDYNEFHIPKSINIPRMNLLGDPSLYLNKKDKYYLLCDKGTISLSCCNILNALGYHCYSIDGGIEKYKENKN